MNLVSQDAEMAEVVSEDVMDWARDLTALRKLFFGEAFLASPINKQTSILQFAEYQFRQHGLDSMIELGMSVVSSLSESVGGNELIPSR